MDQRIQNNITEFAILIIGIVIIVNCLRINTNITNDCSKAIVGKLNTYVLIIVLVAMFMPISEFITSLRCNVNKKTPGNIVLASLTFVLSIVILILTSVMQANIEKDDKCIPLRNAVRDNLIISVLFLVMSSAFLAVSGGLFGASKYKITKK